MQEHILKQMIKNVIDSTNWWPKIKNNLKLIVDFSRSFDEAILGIEMYLIWIPNCW